MKKIIYAIAILMAVSCNKAADTVVFGTIRTADEDNPVAEAVAVKDGKFIYVGDKAGAEAYIKKGTTEVIDHTGKGMVMPGCFDGHAHYIMPMALANMKGGVLFDANDDKAAVLKKVDAAALEAANAGKKCLFGFGWNFYIIRMSEQEQISLAELDAVSHGLSVALFDSGGHNMYCNSECFRRCGIIDDKGNVLIKKIPGGLLELDEKGHITGFIDERVTGYPMRMGGIIYDEIIDDEVACIALEKSQELLLSTGFVSYMEGWSNCLHPSKFYEVANRFDKEGKLKLLLSMSYEVEPWQKDMSEQIDYLVSLREKYGTSHVRPQYLKVFMDGCVESFTGSMFKPYVNGTTYNSHWAVDRLADITRECNSKDITVHTHTMGDKAIAEATDAYVKGGDGEHRNCLVHLRNVRRGDYKRFADNNIACVASLTWHVGASAEEEAVMASLVDEEYVKHAYPIKSFFDAGAKVSSHCDFPANGTCPQDPFGIMEIAVTGQMVNPYTGAVYPAFDTEELITLEQALQALTMGGAWQLGLDNERGSIKVGKYADFVLADQDVFDCPVTDIHKTKVVSTWFEGEKVYQAEMAKVADYLYEYEADGYGTEAPTTLLTDDGPVTFGCSAVRNGNFYGRNLDLGISETCEFVIRTKATAERRHASIGVANTCFSNITEDMVQAGLSEEQLNFIPWMMMDGVNDAGLVCNINVVNMSDIEAVPHTHTNPGKPQIMVMQLVRALLDNCASVAEAMEFISAHDITPMPYDIAGTWDGHIMIADADNNVIVEFTGEKGSEVKYIETNIMTNFYNHMYEATGAYPPHACGVERYEILKANYDGGNTMQGMWELMKKVQYTQAYDESTEPFWCTEHIDGVPGGDITWTKEQLLQEAETQKMLNAYKVYEQTGEYNPADGMWFTAHNSVYDIANRTLWVTVREKYEKHYEFKL